MCIELKGNFWIMSFPSSHEGKIKGKGNIQQGKTIGCHLTVTKNVIPVFLLSK